MSNYDKITVRESMMSLLALITEFRSNSGFLPNYPLMPLGDVILTTTFSRYPSYLSCRLCDQVSNQGLVRLLAYFNLLLNYF